MLTYFKCPDGTQRPIKECLESCPNPEGRCLSLPTLYELGQVRPWKGRASTTQLLKGVRQVYLEITQPYAIDPFDSAFMLLGTRHHQQLDSTAKLLEMLSEQNIDTETTGILDLLEPDTLDTGNYILCDYKTSGSYAVAKALGRKNNQGEPDMLDWELQLNNYRMGVEKLGLTVSRMVIQCCVRDGGTRTARDNKVPEKFVRIPVKRLDD